MVIDIEQARVRGAARIRSRIFVSVRQFTGVRCADAEVRNVDGRL